MKKLSKIIVTGMLAAAMTQTVFAAEIPRESAPMNATEEQIQIT